MPCCEISDCAQMSKTIIAVRHFGLGGRESLETAVTNWNKYYRKPVRYSPIGLSDHSKNLSIHPSKCRVKICKIVEKKSVRDVRMSSRQALATVKPYFH